MNPAVGAAFPPARVHQDDDGCFKDDDDYGYDDFDNDDDDDDTGETFSVAPMMGHTHRHYRYLWRLLSRKATLYTEMIPAAAVVRAYLLEADTHHDHHHHHHHYDARRRLRPSSIPIDDDDNARSFFDQHHPPERIVEVLQSHRQRRVDFPHLPPTPLEELLRDDTATNNNGGGGGGGGIVLQLGGGDPTTLALAAAVGSAYHHHSDAAGTTTTAAVAAAYRSINLNCGCPSALVTGSNSSSLASRIRTGAALMDDPDRVVSCLNAMSHAMDGMRETTAAAAVVSGTNAPTVLSVKHRLGVANINEYRIRRRRWEGQDGASSSAAQQEQEEAYKSCKAFVSHLVSSPASDHMLSRIQVHARLALLGMDDGNDSNGNGGESEGKHGRRSLLWLPGKASDGDAGVDSDGDGDGATTIKVNHGRVQYQAKKRARKATIDNRSIPPLHPGVVEHIARDFFPSLQVVSNGGVQSLDDVHDRMGGGGRNAVVHGVMVGRTAINHPCAFAGVDRGLFLPKRRLPPTFPSSEGRNANKNLSPRLVCHSRYDVLVAYMDYCRLQEEEFAFRRRHGINNDDNADDNDDSNDPAAAGLLGAFRKRLVAPVYHLMVGEVGNAEYQRLLKKLTDRAQRHSAVDMIQAGMAHVPSTVLHKPLSDHVPWVDVQRQMLAKTMTTGGAGVATKRSGAMHRIIY